MKRFLRNFNTISKSEHKKLMNASVCIVGVGGLGEYVAEYLARIGVKEIKLIDYDIFNETNLNRQLFSNEKNIGLSKVLETKKYLKKINSEQKVITINSKITKANVLKLIKGSDIVIDGLDNVKTRLIVKEACDVLNIYYIHGAINGLQVQVSTLPPKSNLLNKLYLKENKKNSSTLSYVPAMCASLEVNEAIKVLLNKKDTLENKLLIIDLNSNDFNIVEFNNE